MCSANTPPSPSLSYSHSLQCVCVTDWSDSFRTDVVVSCVDVTDLQCCSVCACKEKGELRFYYLYSELMTLWLVTGIHKSCKFALKYLVLSDGWGFGVLLTEIIIHMSSLLAQNKAHVFISRILYKCWINGCFLKLYIKAFRFKI